MVPIDSAQIRCGLPRPAARAETRLQAEPPRGLYHPPRTAERPAPPQTHAQALDLRFRLRRVDVHQPIVRPRHRTRIQRRPGSPLVRGQRRTGPRPVLGRRDQMGAERVALDVAQHREQVLVLLDGEGAEAALLDVAAGVVVLVVAACVCGEQPRHIVAQCAVAAGPEREVEVVGH
jgi:hypothetical protein